MVGIFQIEGADSRDVGRYAYMIIRNTDCRPYSANFIFSFSEDFEVPYFIRIGNGQTFAAVLFYEISHQADSLTGCCTALQCHTLQFFNHKHTFGIFQIPASAYGSFTYPQLLFVDARVGGVHEGICFSSLWYLPLDFYISLVGYKLGMHTAIVNIHYSIPFITFCRNHVYPGSVPAVACMTGYN